MRHDHYAFETVQNTPLFVALNNTFATVSVASRPTEYEAMEALSLNRTVLVEVGRSLLQLEEASRAPLPPVHRLV
jgi:hypothetical protein